MAIVVDTAPIVALLDRADARHDEVLRFLTATDEPLFLSPFVLAEADYLARRGGGADAAASLLDSIRRGRFLLERIDAADIERCAEIMSRYRDLDIGVADASIVLLAERHRTERVLTFDERDFRAMRPRSGRPFVLLPADA